MDRLTVASFFSGVGLLDLGLEWAGWRTVSVSEVDPYASRVLALRYPDAPNLGDIHAIESVPPATLWAGGFPCQPVSVAGRRTAQDDDRWLWPVWAELIGDLRPRHLLLENVSNLLAVNGGRAFGDVLGDLAARGYDAEWDCLPAAAVGAPHLRDRVWIVAHAIGERGPRRPARPREAQGRRPRGQATGPGLAVADPSGVGPEVAQYAQDSSRPGGPWQADIASRRGADQLSDAVFAGLEGHERGVLALADHRRRNTDPARPGWWAAEPGLGRVADGVPRRVDRLRCIGNGVVPQVAEFIGWRLRAMIEAAELEAAA